jgi:hypothetical protein
MLHDWRRCITDLLSTHLSQAAVVPALKSHLLAVYVSGNPDGLRCDADPPRAWIGPVEAVGSTVVLGRVETFLRDDVQLGG